MRVLLLLMALTLSASQSFDLAPSRRITSTFPGGSPMCANVTSFRAEGQFRLVTTPTAQEWLVRQDTSWGLSIDSLGNFGSLRLDTAGAASINISGWTNARWRFQRNTTSAQYQLEVWNEATGERRENIVTDPSPTSTNPLGCAFYVGAQSGNAMTASVSSVRIYSSTVALGSAPPPRLLTSNFADLLDLELEGNLADSSGRGLNGAMSIGTAAYSTTTDLSPIATVSGPVSVRAGALASFSATCLANEDNSNCAAEWNQLGGPAGGTWTGRTTLAPTFRTTIFGQYDLVAILSTALFRTQQSITLGASASDGNGGVVVSDAAIQFLLGPMARYGAGWSWFDDRAITAAEYQIDMQTGANGASAFWSAPWETNLAGTVSVTNGSATVTGTGTTFQTSFCGGAGNTTPSANFGQIYIKYNSADYPGTQGLARYNVTACNSQTSITVNAAWAHATGTQSGISYARADSSIAGWWTFTNTPGNYYDNVLAFYALYYRTGLTKYRTAARNLARNWWYGPFYDRGKNYDTSAMGGTFISAGPARGQSITGLILWSLDTGENIWPGMNYVLSWFRDVGWTFGNTRSWAVQVGDLREQGYLTAAYALAARLHPNSATRQTYRGYLKDYINLFWQPLQLPTGEWRNTVVSNASYAGASSVAVANGSANITLNGATWSASTFDNGNFNPVGYQARVWFFSNFSNSELPGKQNSDLGGESTYYRVINVTGSTTAVLDRPYTGTTGNKGMIVSSLVGFGTQPFMMGLTAGVFGTYAHDALVWHGDTAEASKARQFAIDGANWLRTAAAYKSAAKSIYGGSTFLNCVAAPTEGGCDGDTVLNGEIMRGIATAYGFSNDANLLAFGNDLYGAVWCKPTGGWSCPAGSNGASYGFYIDDPPTGFMLNRADPLTNKWLGFYFGYGFNSDWPIRRLGGVAPLDTRTVTMSLAVPAGATSTSVLYTAPDGSQQTVTCTLAAGRATCSLPTDWRQGNYLHRITHSVASGSFVSDSLPLRVQ